MPVFDMVERQMVNRFHFPPGLLLRLIARSAYVGKLTKFHVYYHIFKKINYI